jgi:hypothetical protein
VRLKPIKTQNTYHTLADGYFFKSFPIEQSLDSGWIEYEASIIYENEVIGVSSKTLISNLTVGVGIY